jgi:hypothetical protein
MRQPVWALHVHIPRRLSAFLTNRLVDKRFYTPDPGQASTFSRFTDDWRRYCKFIFAVSVNADNNHKQPGRRT